MKSVLVTGCNRGIGLSLIKNLLALRNPPKHIIATCRKKENASELLNLANNDRVKILEVDLQHFNKYDETVKQIESITKDAGLNLLINNAGITTKFTRLPMVKVEQLIENYVVNTAVPIMFTKACIPLLKKAAVNNADAPMGVNKAAVINISSILGSLTENKDGGFYPYRCSKSALNAATKSMSLDFKGDAILVSAIHPGWCKTDMGGPNAPLETDKATAILLDTLTKLTSKENGAFLQYDGKVLPY